MNYWLVCETKKDHAWVNIYIVWCSYSVSETLTNKHSVFKSQSNCSQGVFILSNATCFAQMWTWLNKYRCVEGVFVPAEIQTHTSDPLYCFVSYYEPRANSEELFHIIGGGGHPKSRLILCEVYEPLSSRWVIKNILLFYRKRKRRDFDIKLLIFGVCQEISINIETQD